MISWVSWLAGLCAAVVLAGCDADAGEPTTLPDVTPSPSVSVSSPVPSPSPSPTPTVEPPGEPADVHDYSEEGVEAFTLYAIDVINYAYQTNDVTHLEQIATADCEFCGRTLNQLMTIGEAGGRVEGGQLVLSTDRMDVTGPAEGFQTSAGVELVVTASRTINGDGQVTNTEVDRDRYYIFNLVREEDAWKLDEVLSSADSQS